MPVSLKSLITRRRLAWTLTGIVLFLVVTILLLPLIARPLLVDAMRDKLKRPVRIEQLSFNPFTLSARLQDIAIGEPQGSGTLLSARELMVNIQLRSLWVGAPVIEEMRLVQPTIKLVRKQDGSYNINDLIEIFSKPSNDPPARYSLNNLQLQAGRIEFDDQAVGAKHLVTDLDLAIPFISNLPYAVNIVVKPLLSARVNGAPFKLAGESLPFSAHRETSVQLTLQDVDLPGWLRYSPIRPGFTLDSAKLDANLALSFQQPDQGGPQVKLSGTAALRDVVAKETDGKALLAFKRLAAELTSFGLSEKRVALRKVTLEQPRLNLVREKSGQLNLMRALESEKAPKQKSSAPSSTASANSAWQVDAEQLEVKDGALEFKDLSLSQSFATQLKDIAITVKQFSTRADRKFSVDASLASDAGETVRHSGKIRLQPFEAEGDAAVTRLDLKRYAPWYRDAAGMAAEQGALDLSTHYRYASGTKPELLLTGLAAKLHALRLHKHGEQAEFLSVGSLVLKGGELDLAQRSINIQALESRDGNVFMAVSEDGQLRLTQADKPHRAGKRSQVATAKTETAAKPVASTSTKPADTPWRFNVKSLAVDNYAAQLDSVSQRRVSSLAVNAIQLRAKDISNQKGSNGTLDLQARLGKNGHLRTAGRMAIEPLDLNLRLDAKGLPLVPLQPWFTEKLNLTLTDGAASVRGQLRLARRPDASLRYAFTGDAKVDQLAMLDKQSSEEFLKWRTLRLRQINAASDPSTSVSIGEVNLADFTTRLVINRDGSFNYQDVLAKEDRAASPDAGTAAKEGAGAAGVTRNNRTEAQLPANAASTSKPRIQVGKVVLQGGHVDFQDHFIQPNYSAELTQLAGTISGLSSDPGMLAEVAIKGRVENQGQLDISGKVNPLSGNLYLDLLAKLRDFELSPLTPYAAKYAGYGIEKGKMSFDVHYKVENRKLTADNKLVLNQLTFGERVDSPTATKLPVQLALALLKDRNGNIDLDLPISGSLDDPQFSVGGIIVKAIFNLIGRALTAPFSLIAHAFSGGGGEQSSHIAFASGSNALQSDAQDKLQSLAKALHDRPGLKLDIAGRADMAYDSAGLKQAALQRKLKVLKMKELVTNGEAVASVDDVQITPAEYPKYLAKVYAQENFPGKPRNVIGIARSLPPEQMQALLLQHIAVRDEDVRALANRRAQEVKDFLVERGQIASERLFIVGGGNAKADEKLPAGRVDLGLGAR